MTVAGLFSFPRAVRLHNTRAYDRSGRNTNANFFHRRHGNRGRPCSGSYAELAIGYHGDFTAHEKRLGREVNVTDYSVSTFRKKIAENDHFFDNRPKGRSSVREGRTACRGPNYSQLTRLSDTRHRKRNWTGCGLSSIAIWLMHPAAYDKSNSQPPTPLGLQLRLLHKRMSMRLHERASVRITFGSRVDRRMLMTGSRPEWLWGHSHFGNHRQNSAKNRALPLSCCLRDADDHQ
jgi:hypothetical protein